MGPRVSSVVGRSGPCAVALVGGNEPGPGRVCRVLCRAARWPGWPSRRAGILVGRPVFCDPNGLSVCVCLCVWVRHGCGLGWGLKPPRSAGPSAVGWGRPPGLCVPLRPPRYRSAGGRAGCRVDPRPPRPRPILAHGRVGDKTGWRACLRLRAHARSGSPRQRPRGALRRSRFPPRNWGGELSCPTAFRSLARTPGNSRSSAPVQCVTSRPSSGRRFRRAPTRFPVDGAIRAVVLILPPPIFPHMGGGPPKVETVVSHITNLSGREGNAAICWPSRGALARPTSIAKAAFARTSVLHPV